jgi:hypothetical protein
MFSLIFDSKVIRKTFNEGLGYIGAGLFTGGVSLVTYATIRKGAEMAQNVISNKEEAPAAPAKTEEKKAN